MLLSIDKLKVIQWTLVAGHPKTAFNHLAIDGTAALCSICQKPGITGLLMILYIPEVCQ